MEKKQENGSPPAAICMPLSIKIKISIDIEMMPSLAPQQEAEEDIIYDEVSGRRYHREDLR